MIYFTQGLLVVIIAYPFIYLILSKGLEFRLSKKVILFTFIITSYLTGFALLEIAPTLIATETGILKIPNRNMIFMAPLVISIVMILIPFFFVRKTVNQVQSEGEKSKND